MRTDSDEAFKRRSYILTLTGTAAGLFAALADFVEVVLRLVEFVL
ncbi:hypothetical protein [Salinibacter ruber]|nr:hypothetical protein [Salinibacter ruber]